MNSEKPQSGTGQPASILVVDDTPANLQVLAGMLKDRGYKVRPVPSGKLALLAAQRDPPDLILLDINMPEMNGYEVCEHLKVDDALKGIPVIFISALTEQLDKVKAFAIGGVDYITKPFQMEELHARVETHLKLRRLQIELEEYSRHLELAREARLTVTDKLRAGDGGTQALFGMALRLLLVEPPSPRSSRPRWTARRFPTGSASSAGRPRASGPTRSAAARPARSPTRRRASHRSGYLPTSTSSGR